MTYAVWENKGTLDMRALTVMGVNAKPNTTNPIGFFGTGLKYAIAILARMNMTVYVQVGTGKTYKVTSAQSTFRDKDFGFVSLLDVDSGETISLPFTTELGKKWDLWQVVRELECNARDEGGGFYTCHEYPEPQQDMVRFIVTEAVEVVFGDAITADILENAARALTGKTIADEIKELRKTVFFDMLPFAEPVSIGTLVQAYRQRSGALYLKGVLTGTGESKNAFIYNYNGHMELTEDRTLARRAYYEDKVSDAILACADTYVLKIILDGGENVNEWNWFCRDVYMPTTFIHPNVKAMLVEYYKTGRKLNQYLLKMVRQMQIEESITLGQDVMSDVEKEMLDTAIIICTENGYPVDEYTIRFVIDLGDGVMGRADQQNQIIYISRYSFEQGIENVMGTLIEEYSHIKFDFMDGERKMQDWLLRQIVVQIQRARRRERVRQSAENTSRPVGVVESSSESHVGSLRAARTNASDLEGQGEGDNRAEPISLDTEGNSNQFDNTGPFF